MKLICATRGRFEDTLLCKSVVKMRGTELTFAIAQNNTAGLSRVYNSEISAETLVFAHDDVVIPNFWWADKFAVEHDGDYRLSEVVREHLRPPTEE